MQAWRAVDRAYVDKTFNGQSWFRMREQYLKKEPMTDRDETYAAIRKLLATLEDPFTRFVEPERYAQLRRGAQGSVTGVGLEVGFSQSKGTLGELLVRAAVPKAAGYLCALGLQNATGGRSARASSGWGCATMRK